MGFTLNHYKSKKMAGEQKATEMSLAPEARDSEVLLYHPTDRALDRAVRVTMPELKT